MEFWVNYCSDILNEENQPLLVNTAIVKQVEATSIPTNDFALAKFCLDSEIIQPLDHNIKTKGGPYSDTSII